MSELSNPEFEGKTLLVRLVGCPEKDSTLIDNAKLELQAGRVFLTGDVTSFGDKANYARARPIGVAWDQVERYLVFESSSQYFERKSEYNENCRQEKNKEPAD